MLAADGACHTKTSSYLVENKPMKKIFMLAAFLFALGPHVSTPVLSAEKLSVVGSWSNLPLHKNFEAPFWREQLPHASGGGISVNLTTFDQLGVSGADVLRLLGDGVFDVGMTVADYVVSDAPELEGLDVPLIASTAGETLAIINLARPMVSDILAERFNAKLLGILPYPPQVLFCKEAYSGIDSLKGRKIRASGRMATKFLTSLGAEGVTMAFSEVPGALERGILDCAVTGAGSGYASGWWEVSDYVIELPIGGWDPVIVAMNMDKWQSLNPELQILIQTETKNNLEDPAWKSAAGAFADEMACLTGDDKCILGTPANMKRVTPSFDDFLAVELILIMSVLPDWAKRTETRWLERWNASVGAATDMQVKIE